MANRTISGNLFKKMVTNGAVNLKNNHKEIDHLNVFPVPDGDTGTNMQMTMMAGIKEVNNVDSQSIIDISKILSRGLLMGARGNSGVILSQFFRGVYSEIAKINDGAATIEEFIQALVGGYQMAYRAVMDPVEGTILTVVRESAEKVLREQPNLSSVEDVLKVYLEQAKETLIKTPDLLPVLKEAGVVDSGGAGFIKIIEGMIMALEGNILNESELAAPTTQDVYHGAQNLGDFDIKFGYCTEFIIKLHKPEKFKENYMKDPLEQMGDSLVLVADDDLVKVHVHTNQPGVALTLAQKYGDLQTVKIENMRVQHSTIMSDSAPQHVPQTQTQPVVEKKKSKYTIIAVASGEGIHEAFKELGVDLIIDGGQTMNPSTEAFVKAVEDLNSDHVIILPNNKNIILSAEQTLELCPDRSIHVLKTKSIATGYASLLAFDPTQEIDDNVEAMNEIIDNMRSGEVTYAIRDTEINGVNIKKGDYIGITRGEIKVSTPTRLETVQALLDDMVDMDKEIMTIFYGSDYDEDELDQIVAHAKKLNPDMEVELIEGKQEIYTYIFAVE
ncbi:MAG: DAK2 domain-containing protein [Acholeplasmataceae bacterium]|nr:MAG: DAK2 domain-containing protein [Acholeplasmataceae bacterium]